MSHHDQADRFEKLARELGCRVDARRANTGTIYVTVDYCRLDDAIIVRFADHADAYATASYSVDPAEGTARGARAFLLRRLNTTEKAIRRLRRARKARKSAQVSRQAVEAVERLISQEDGDRERLGVWVWLGGRSTATEYQKEIAAGLRARGFEAVRPERAKA